MSGWLVYVCVCCVGVCVCVWPKKCAEGERKGERERESCPSKLCIAVLEDVPFFFATHTTHTHQRAHTHICAHILYIR